MNLRCLFKRTSLIVLWLFVANGLHALTLSDIETEVRRHIRDTGTTASEQRYSDTVIDAVINEVQREVINLTWAVETSTNFATVAGTTYYALPTDYLATIQVEYTKGTQKTELTEISEKALRQQNPAYEKDSGVPTQYFTRFSTHSQTTMQMGFYPTAGTSNTGTVRVQYNNLPADLSSDSDVPFDGYLHLYPYHHTLVWGTVARFKLLESEAQDAQSYFQMYQNAIGIMQDRLGRKPNYNVSFGAGPTR